MRRIQVVMEPELDDWLEREASTQGTSKSALIRDSVRAHAEEETFDNGLSETLGMFPHSDRFDEIESRLYLPLVPP